MTLHWLHPRAHVKHSASFARLVCWFFFAFDLLTMADRPHLLDAWLRSSMDRRWLAQQKVIGHYRSVSWEPSIGLPCRTRQKRQRTTCPLRTFHASAFFNGRYLFTSWHGLPSMLAPPPLVCGPPLQPNLFLCFVAFALRLVFSCSCFLPGVFKKGAKKVSVADDRMDYYTVRAAPASAGHDSRSTQVAVHAGLTGINDSFHMNGPCPERFETPLRRCTRVCSLRLFFVLVVVLAIGDLRMKATAHLTFKQPLFHPMGCQNLSKLGWQMGQI